MRDGEIVLREARELNARLTAGIERFTERFGRAPVLYVDDQGRVDVARCDAHIREAARMATR